MRTEYKKEVIISLSTLMSPLFMSAHLLAEAVSRTEDASGGQEAVHSLWSRLFCGPLKMRRVPQEAFLSTARIFRTIGGPLRYRMPTTQPPSHHSTPSSPVPNARQRQVAAAAEPGIIPDRTGVDDLRAQAET